MSLFAEIDDTSKVIRVIDACKEFIESGVLGLATNWIETTLTPNETTGYNYPGPGYLYSSGANAFIPPIPTQPPDSIEIGIPPPPPIPLDTYDNNTLVAIAVANSIGWTLDPVTHQWVPKT